MRRKAPVHALRASNTAEPKHRSSRLNHALVACWLAAVLVLGCVSTWSVKDHEAVALPPLTVEAQMDSVCSSPNGAYPAAHANVHDSSTETDSVGARHVPLPSQP